MLKNANMERHLPGYSQCISWVTLAFQWLKLFLNCYLGFGFKSFYIKLELTFKQQKQKKKRKKWFLILLKKIKLLYHLWNLFFFYFYFQLSKKVYCLNEDIIILVNKGGLVLAVCHPILRHLPSLLC